MLTGIYFLADPKSIGTEQAQAIGTRNQVW